MGLVLLNLFSRDLKLGVSYVVAKFADDTRLFRMVKTKADCEDLRKGLHKLDEWAKTWQTKFGVGKKCSDKYWDKNLSFISRQVGFELAETKREKAPPSFGL